MKHSGRKKLRRVDAIDARRESLVEYIRELEQAKRGCKRRGCGPSANRMVRPRYIAIVSGILVLNKF